MTLRTLMRRRGSQFSLGRRVRRSDLLKPLSDKEIDIGKDIVAKKLYFGIVTLACSDDLLKAHKVEEDKWGIARFFSK